MLEIRPGGRFFATVKVPGSKYVANRALPLAALASGTSFLRNVPEGEDIEVCREGLRRLGAAIEAVPGEPGSWAVTGAGGRFPATQAELYTAGSGTFSRFVLPLAALAAGPVKVTANEKMSSRPMGEIFAALRGLGVGVEAGTGLPAVITGPLRPGRLSMDGSVSSQFFSAFLIAGTSLAGRLDIDVVGELVSQPYIDLTVKLIRDFGGTVASNGYRSFTVAGPQRLQARDFAIETDPVSATYFMACAALTAGEARIPHWNAASPQGEAGFPSVLARMGCSVELAGDVLCVKGPSAGLRAVRLDMNAMPDAAPTLAVLAAFAKGTTRIEGVAHLRHKESDRLGDLAAELRKLGAVATAGEDFLEVVGNPAALHGAVIDPHRDHRLAMAFAVAGLRLPGLFIEDEACVGKSFPGYWEALRRSGVSACPA